MTILPDGQRINVEWHLWQAILGLAIENLTDEAYAEHLNAPNPFTGERVLEIGRSARLSARYLF